MLILQILHMLKFEVRENCWEAVWVEHVCRFTLTKVGVSMIPALESTIEERASPTKSQETKSSSVNLPDKDNLSATELQKVCHVFPMRLWIRI